MPSLDQARKALQITLGATALAARDANMAVAAFVLARLCERERRVQMRIPEDLSRAA